MPHARQHQPRRLRWARHPQRRLGQLRLVRELRVRGRRGIQMQQLPSRIGPVRRQLDQDDVASSSAAAT
jgi:hypothetical protein